MRFVWDADAVAGCHPTNNIFVMGAVRIRAEVWCAVHTFMFKIQCLGKHNINIILFSRICNNLDLPTSFT